MSGLSVARPVLSGNKRLDADAYGAVADVEEDLLRLLGAADDVGEAGGFLGRHPVVRKAALEGGSFQT